MTKTSIFDKLTTMNSFGNPFAREWQIFSAHHIPTALNKIFNYQKHICFEKISYGSCIAMYAVRECYLNVEEEPECREGEPQQAYLVCRWLIN